MLSPYDVANFFLSLDPDRKLFNQKLITKNGATFYEGNARLNKYMHLAQNIYLAMTGTLLIDTQFYAYSNGAVIPSIQRDYRMLSSKAAIPETFPAQEQEFLTKFFHAFENADIDEIIEIDHEDNAWKEKCNGTTLTEQKIDTLAHIKEYKVQYADIIKVLNRMEPVC